MSNSADRLPEIRLISLETPAAPPPTDPRWLQVETFLQTRSLAGSTRKAYQRELQRFLNWTDQPWSKLTPQQISDFKTYLKTQNLSNRSINCALTALTSFLTWLRSTDSTQFPFDPTEAVKKEQVSRSTSQHLSKAQLTALYLAIEHRGETQERDRALLAVLSHGVRAEEVIQLNIGDYDGTGLKVWDKEEKKVKTIDLSPKVREDLNTYLEQQETSNAESPLFTSVGPNRMGKRLGYQGLYYTVKALGKIAVQQAQQEKDKIKCPDWQRFSSAELQEIATMENVYPSQVTHAGVRLR